MSQRGFISNGLKYKKLNKQLKRLQGSSSNNYNVNTESFILKITRGASLSPKQLESARRVIRRNLNRDVYLKSYICCDLPRTSKSSGIRMGKGKGNVNEWVSFSPAGKLLFSSSNTGYFQASNAMKKASKKFSTNNKYFFNRFFSKRIFENLFEN